MVPVWALLWIIFELGAITGFVLLGVVCFKLSSEQMYAQAGMLHRTLAQHTTSDNRPSRVPAHITIATRTIHEKQSHDRYVLSMLHLRPITPPYSLAIHFISPRPHIASYGQHTIIELLAYPRLCFCCHVCTLPSIRRAELSSPLCRRITIYLIPYCVHCTCCTGCSSQIIDIHFTAHTTATPC